MSAINTSINPLAWKDIEIKDTDLISPNEGDTLDKVAEFATSQEAIFGYSALGLYASSGLPVIGDYTIPSAVIGATSYAVYRRQAVAKKAIALFKSACSSLKSNFHHMLNGLPPDSLIHMHNCLEQMQQPEFSDYARAKRFLKALSSNPAHFEIEGWSEEESRALNGLIRLMPDEASPRTECYTEQLTKTYTLIHEKFTKHIGFVVQLKSQAPYVALQALKNPFNKVLDLLDRSGNSQGHFLRPFLVDSLKDVAGWIQKTGMDYLHDEDQKNCLKEMCTEFASKLDAGNTDISKAIQDFFGTRIALMFGYKIPFTSPALQDPKLAKPMRKKTPVNEEQQSTEQLHEQTAKFREECIEKGAMVSLYWILVQLIGGDENAEITKTIEGVWNASNPKSAFHQKLASALNSATIPLWRKLLAKILWYLTPCHKLAEFLLRRSLTVTEKWCDQQRLLSQGNVHHIPGAKAIESTFKKWLIANSAIQDQGAYEDEISNILANGRKRKVRINQLTNFLVDTCFPAINLIGWYAKLDVKVIKWPTNVSKWARPPVWVIGTALRVGLFLVKSGLYFIQRALNFIGRFSLKLILKRLKVMHQLFDFRSRLEKGDHHSIEDKLKGFALLLLKELNQLDLDSDPSEEEIVQLQRLNQNVEQCVHSLLKVIDLHDTSRWDRAGIQDALKGNVLRKTAYDLALPTAIEKGVALFNEVVWKRFIVDNDRYMLVKCNLYESFSFAMTDTKPPPPEIDEEIKNATHEFRTKVIRQILLRTLADLGEDERKKASAYVKDLEAQKAEYAQWKQTVEDVKSNLCTHDNFDLTELFTSVKTELENIEAIYKKYLRPLQSAYSKVNEIYNWFLMPIQDIQAAAVNLRNRLDQMLKYRQWRQTLEKLQTERWLPLQNKCGYITQAEITSLTDQIASLDLVESDAVSKRVRERKKLYKDKILCQIYLENCEKMQDRNHWEWNRLYGQNQALVTMLNLQNATREEIDQKKTAIEQELEGYTLPEAKSIDDLRTQLAALGQEIISNSTDLSSFSCYQSSFKIFNVLLKPRQLGSSKDTFIPLERVIAIRANSQNYDSIVRYVNIFLENKSDELQQVCQNWLTDRQAADALKEALHDDQEALGKVDALYAIAHRINTELLNECIGICRKCEDAYQRKAISEISDIKISLANLENIGRVEAESRVRDFHVSVQDLENPIQNNLENPNQTNIEALITILQKLKELKEVDEYQIKQDITKIQKTLRDLENNPTEVPQADVDELKKSFGQKLKIYAVKRSLQRIEMIDKYQTKEDITAIRKILDDLENNPTAVDAIKTSFQSLEKKLKDKKLTIPYLNFVYSTDLEEDPLLLRFLVWLIGENAERMTQKVLRLSKHPVFLPWALREVIVAAVA